VSRAVVASAFRVREWVAGFRPPAFALLGISRDAISRDAISCDGIFCDASIFRDGLRCVRSFDRCGRNFRDGIFRDAGSQRLPTNRDL